MEVKSLRWGLLACGGIAKVFAAGLKDARYGVLAAVGSRDLERAQAFAAGLDGGDAVAVHGTYESLLADPGVDAVYISTPHPQHAEWIIRAAEAGKHVLCEKPMTLNAWEAGAVLEACRENGVMFCEAFMYRFAPHVAKLRELIAGGAIGEVRHVRAEFGFATTAGADSRWINAELGGGGILDVGCYAMSVARLVAGEAIGKRFDDPVTVRGVATLHPEQATDVWSTASLAFESGITAQVATAVQVALGQGLVIYGTGGRIECAAPFLTAREGGAVTIRVLRVKAEPEEIVVESPRHLYAYEADAMAEALPSLECRQMSWGDSLGNMQALDAWRKEAGVVYPGEKAATLARPLRHRAQKKRLCPMGSLPGVDKPVSRVVMGIDNQKSVAQVAAICDDFMERGGNAFDTAWVYGGGYQERFFGSWITARGVRDSIVVVVKGAHTPECNPVSLTRQLATSLDRLQTNYADAYLMHRDNPDVPVGEFVDVLNEHFRAGRIRCFGGSNWSKERLEEANAYAAAKGLEPMRIVSNNFSLARMVDPVWGGCVAASEPEFRNWLEEQQMPLLAWSSQARGFFVRGDRNFREDAELVRCWYSEENFERLDRARELAKQKGCSPINIALAYVLAQAFPAFSLIGPRSLAETASTWEGLDVALTEEEVRWLDLR